MTTLPTRSAITSGATTNAEQKVNFGDQRDFIADLLGTDSSDKPAARAALGAAGLSAVNGYKYPQTTVSGPVDANGFAAFGGSTGAATLTASGTIKVAAAAGGDLSYIGSIVDPEFTSPAGNGTGYFVLSVTSAGVVTASVRTLPRIDQYAGTYSTSSGQVTFNTQEMTVKVGNGSAASQVYEVCIGECAHTAGVWSGSPTWYQLKGAYASGYTATLPSTGTPVTRSHNLGTQLCRGGFRIKCLSSEYDFAVGEIENNPWMQGGTSNSSVIAPSINTTKSFRVVTGSTLSVGAFHRSTGTGVNLTAASWAYEMWAKAEWL